MNKNNLKHILIYLLCGIFAVVMIIISFLIYEKINSDIMEEKNLAELSKLVHKHKNEWIDLLIYNNEMRSYMERLYATKDDFRISYINGEFTFNEIKFDKFNFEEFGKLEKYFEEFQCETIRLNKQNYTKSDGDTYVNSERKILEIISPLTEFGNHYYTISIIYSPEDGKDCGEKIFPGWYYNIFFNT